MIEEYIRPLVCDNTESTYRIVIIAFFVLGYLTMNYINATSKNQINTNTNDNDPNEESDFSNDSEEDNDISIIGKHSKTQENREDITFGITSSRRSTQESIHCPLESLLED
mmetsp:Transcript_13743/g.14297  ORF Transcript_13743/g.14297 Transcript_13743/m.14297 type:complete len:111 (+) Transcript_13743:62-394(+)